MAALTEAKEVVEKAGKTIASPMAVDVIYRGALCKHNAAGFAAPCAAEVGAVFAGVAYEDEDNSAGSAGDEDVKIIKEGVFLLEGAAFTQTDVGQLVYASDDQTVSTTQAANEQQVGRIEALESATLIWVDIKPQI